MLLISRELGIKSTVFFLLLDESIECSLVTLHLVQLLSYIVSAKFHSIILKVTNYLVELFLVNSHGFLHGCLISSLKCLSGSRHSSRSHGSITLAALKPRSSREFLEESRSPTLSRRLGTLSDLPKSMKCLLRSTHHTCAWLTIHNNLTRGNLLLSIFSSLDLLIKFGI